MPVTTRADLIMTLLGASVRGLPVSEAPVSIMLEVCSTSNNWSSGERRDGR